MKIDGTDGIHPIPGSERNDQGPEKPQQGFREIFQKAFNPGHAQTVSPATAQFVRPIVPLMETGSPVVDRDGVVENVENLLDLLEDFRRELLQPENAAKGLDALIQRLDGVQKKLAPDLDQLPDGDRLRTILNESLVTASVEIFKYRRGDYLAA